MYANVDDKNIYSIFSDIKDIMNVVNEVSCLDELDYIIHCASNTTSSYMISNPVETIDGIVAGTKAVLQLALEQKIKSILRSNML
jgi:nucleoside-diphosphate-sugar epimerase